MSNSPLSPLSSSKSKLRSGIALASGSGSGASISLSSEICNSTIDSKINNYKKTRKKKKKNSKLGELVELEGANQGEVVWSTYNIYFAAAGKALLVFHWPLTWIVHWFLSAIYYLQHICSCGCRPDSRIQAMFLSIFPLLDNTNFKSNSLGIATAIFLSLLSTFVEIAWLGWTYSVAAWMTSMEASGKASDIPTQVLLWTAAIPAATLFKEFSRTIGSMRAARAIHDGFLLSITRAHLSWFQKTPTGRIVNRLGQDVSVIDWDVMVVLRNILDAGNAAIYIVAVIAWNFPILVPVLIPVVALAFYIAHKYVITSRDLKRMESVAKSPIYVHFSETVHGRSIIRAFGASDRFFDKLLPLLDDLNRCHINLWLTNRWLHVRMDGVAAIIGGLISALIIYGPAKMITPMKAAVALGYCLEFTETLAWLIRSYAETQINMNAVERIVEYSNLPCENYQAQSFTEKRNNNRNRSRSRSNSSDNGLITSNANSSNTDGDEIRTSSSLLPTASAWRPLGSACFSSACQFFPKCISGDGNSNNYNRSNDDGFGDTKNFFMWRPAFEPAVPATTRDVMKVVVDENWPRSAAARGSGLTFEDIKLKYPSRARLALSGVSFSAPAGSKIGICGRTGAGKSSMISALLRLVEPCSGRIIIDGVNILTLPLHTLRSRIAVVPQNPELYRGSIRSNIDPFKLTTDEAIWQALDRCGISDHVHNMSGDELKDKIVTDGGDNFSVGQRQLLCIARAMLRYSNVLILDECSSACDAQTDENIQTTIQSHFKASTVLCIAHRLKTIASYDLILVMDDGKVAEIGTPASLLENDGLFRAMCEASGDFDELSALATATRHQHYG